VSGVKLGGRESDLTIPECDLAIALCRSEESPRQLVLKYCTVSESCNSYSSQLYRPTVSTAMAIDKWQRDKSVTKRSCVTFRAQEGTWWAMSSTRGQHVHPCAATRR
jgi:hypothetical protein